jgi:hypothetical protein
MFNPLTPSQMVTAIGRAAGAAGRRQEPLDEFARGQLMSVYSASRHLAIELASFGAELRDVCDAIATVAADAARRPDCAQDSRALGELVERLRQAGAAPEAGAAIAELLALCRSRTGTGWEQLRDQVRQRLRTLCTREVSLLAEGIEAGRA